MRRDDLSDEIFIIDTPMAPPYWALLERQLLDAQAEACRAFYDHYFDERGYLLCVPRWGGDDGPDDAAENQLNWTILHALGAHDDVLNLYLRGWEGHLLQYTEAKTVDVPMARDGMYYKEFPVMFDWFHHSEGYSAFFLQGLSTPHDRKMKLRNERYAGFYMGEDPHVPNYDPEQNIIRSMFNGSRGPMLRKATGLDWAGDPIEIEGRFRLGHGERSYEEMVAHFKDYNDVAGDSPLNLCATTPAFNAYAQGSGEKYRSWLLRYVDGWVERTEQNDGLIPTNVGLDGTLGGECEGRWWGGVYGWGFSVIVPQTGELAHRSSFAHRAPYGFGNALLMSGDQRYVDVWRGVLERVNENAREIDGELMAPHSYGEDGWYNFQPYPYRPGALEVYYWSMDEADISAIGGNLWIDYLQGKNSTYPVDALSADLAAVRRKAEEVRADGSTPDTRLSDDMNRFNPATTETLTQLMLGGLPTGRVGFPLHARLRYFDPERRRAGIPEDVAALVDELGAESVSVTLVNTNQISARDVIVQGGAYGEHEFVAVSVEDGEEVELEGNRLRLRLEPGSGVRLRIRMRRYANPPRLGFPW